MSFRRILVVACLGMAAHFLVEPEDPAASMESAVAPEPGVSQAPETQPAGMQPVPMTRPVEPVASRPVPAAPRVTARELPPERKDDGPAGSALDRLAGGTAARFAAEAADREVHLQREPTPYAAVVAGKTERSSEDEAEWAAERRARGREAELPRFEEREQAAGSRDPGAGSREVGAERREVARVEPREDARDADRRDEARDADRRDETRDADRRDEARVARVDRRDEVAREVAATDARVTDRRAREVALAGRRELDLIDQRASVEIIPPPRAPAPRRMPDAAQARIESLNAAPAAIATENAPTHSGARVLEIAAPTQEQLLERLIGTAKLLDQRMERLDAKLSALARTPRHEPLQPAGPQLLASATSSPEPAPEPEPEPEVATPSEDAADEAAGVTPAPAPRAEIEPPVHGARPAVDTARGFDLAVGLIRRLMRRVDRLEQAVAVEQDPIEDGPAPEVAPAQSWQPPVED